MITQTALERPTPSSRQETAHKSSRLSAKAASTRRCASLPMMAPATIPARVTSPV